MLTNNDTTTASAEQQCWNCAFYSLHYYGNECHALTPRRLAFPAPTDSNSTCDQWATQAFISANLDSDGFYCGRAT